MAKRSFITAHLPAIMLCTVKRLRRKMCTNHRNKLLLTVNVDLKVQWQSYPPTHLSRIQIRTYAHDAGRLRIVIIVISFECIFSVETFETAPVLFAIFCIYARVQIYALHKIIFHTIHTEAGGAQKSTS